MSENEHDDLDNEYDEEEEVVQRSSKKSKHSHEKPLKLVDDIAEDEDEPSDEGDEEEEEEEGSDVEGLIAEEGEEDIPRKTGKARLPRGGSIEEDDALHMSLDAQRERDEHERLRRQLEERYGPEAEDAELDWDAEEQRHAEQRKRSTEAALPSVKDPKLWLVKCDPGKEEESVLALLKRFILKQTSPDEQMFITSCFTTPASHGYIYIEAFKEVHVKRAIRGIRTLKWWRCALVPITEMVSAVKFTEKVQTVRPKQWIRLKRGIYQGDLAQVIRTSDQNTIATVKMIPRIDMIALEESARTGDKKRKRSAVRPQAQLFDKKEIERLGGQVTRKNASVSDIFRSWTMFNGNKFKHGFLYKDVKVDTLQTEHVNPTADEIEKFQSRQGVESDAEEHEEDEQMDVTPIVSMSDDKPPVFSLNDRVIVVEGGMKNITGRIATIGKLQVTIIPDSDQPIHLPIDLMLNQIKKFFRLGDHVKVVSGPYKNETGMITQVKESDDSLSIYSDISLREIKVHSQDVIETSEVSTGRDSLGNYELFDLVQMTGDIVGVIVKVEIASFKLLTNRGVVQTVRLQEIGKKRHSKFAAALDSQSNQIVVDDVVNVNTGTFAGRQGTIKHIYRSTLFLFSRSHMENSGIFVVPAKQVTLVGQGYRKSSLAAQSPHIGNLGSKSPHPNLQRNAPPPTKFQRHGQDPLVGKQVVIVGGPYKSYIGIVLEVVDDNVRVELHALFRKVMVKKHQVQDRSIVRPQVTQDYALGSQTPMLGSRTPMYGGATPAYGYESSMTPRHDAWGSRTPSHPGAGGMTPSRDHDVWSAQTPHHTASDSPEHAPENDDMDSYWNGVPTTPGIPQTPYETVDTPMQPTTPGAYPQTPNTPGAAPRTPHTPYDPYRNHPQTPAAGDVEAKDDDTTSTTGAAGASLLPVGAKVQVGNAQGTITKVNPDRTYKVKLDGATKQQNVSSSDVSPVVPAKGDNVVIMSGDHAGKEGNLIGINHSEGILEIDGDIIIQQLAILCKKAK